MDPSQTEWPRTWLMTDERLGDRLWSAIDRLPEGSGIVFRHYSLDRDARAELAGRVSLICKERAFALAVAADADLVRAVGADLIHKPAVPTPGLPFSLAVHSMAEAVAAVGLGASLLFVSPVFETRSHPGRRALGPDLAKQIAQAARAPAIALGGMDAQKFAQLSEYFHGWAGIDAWLGDADA
jgi:thiamine-phosphate pyrophosphorylase